MRGTRFIGIGICALVVLTSGCSIQLPFSSETKRFFELDLSDVKVDEGVAPITSTLLVRDVTAPLSIDNNKIAYLKGGSEVAYYALSFWTDTPPTQITRGLKSWLQRLGAFENVVGESSGVLGKQALQCELNEFRFDRNSKKVTVRMNATLTDLRTRKVLAARDFTDARDVDSEKIQSVVESLSAATRGILSQIIQWIRTTPIENT